MYKVACSLTAFVCLVLFVIFLVAPAAYTAGYGVVAGEGGIFFGRRLSPMLLGLAIILWMLRDHADVAVQWAVAITMSVTFAGVAGTGVCAYMTGVAGQTILLAAVGELAIAAAFLVTLIRR